MNADSAAPGANSRWQRYRSLHARLRAAPFAYAAGFALALACMTAFGRVAMLAIGFGQGYLQGLHAAQLAWFGAELGHDLLVFAAFTGLIGGLLRVLPRRFQRLGLLLGYLLLLCASLVVIVSVPLYAALQSTLAVTQLLLAGGARDLAESALGFVPLPVFGLAILLLLAACLCVPLLGALALRVGQRVPRRTLLLLSVASSLLLLVERVLPEDSAPALQMSPVYEFAGSLGRFYLRRRLPPPDMRGAPHFERKLIYGTPPAAVATETLVDTSKLPLRQPNVVLIVLESAATRYTGLWNGRPQDTPRMAEMSAHGLMFDQYYSPTPVSMKSLFALSCSAYPHTTPTSETYTNPSIDCMSISELLKEHGYRTGLFHGGRFSYTRKDAFFKHRQYDVMRDAADLRHRFDYPKVPWGCDDRAVIDDATEWLERTASTNPFFLHLIFLAPHEPYEVHDVPTPFGEKKSVDRYRNATLFIDSQVGRVWDWLKAHNKADDTLLVIVGDHGESFGEHRGDFLHGGRIYESSVRTPMMLVNPRIFSGKRTDRIANHLDMLPTVLDLIGLPKPARHQGMSLLRGYQPHMLYFYADWQRHYLGLRDGQWKYIYNVDRERHELFDLGSDPDEKHNLAYRMPQHVETYAKRVLGFEQYYRELVPNYERYVNGKDACADKPQCYLEDLKPVLQHGLMRKNKSGSGFPLQLADTVYEHGMGVAPLSILRYNIRGDGFRTLKGGVGHHTQGGNANLSLKVSTEIYLDDRLIWSSGKLTADEPAKAFDLDISGGGILELIGYDVDAEDWRDYIDWVDVKLVR